ncbi:hypothetical protein EYC84_007068 [Monilinia fructicola]|uniref:Uncharacterized protein n=1 Tax=Monilinia fructicola TaxID=38448 RepID=A0A5M9K839_MONFR|nr:hypothetical protein EYC84_007068 [Monilinia fructicola]
MCVGVCHVANFFKFHLKAGKGEGLLAHAYADLPQAQCPQPWLGQLKPGTQQLGTHWKGAYFYVNAQQLTKMRIAGDDTDSGPYSDELDGGEFFQKFNKQHWPESWERVLQNDPFSNTAPEPVNHHGPRRHTRSKKNMKEAKEIPNPGLKYFYGSSKDSSSTAHFYGAVHAIPPQSGIPGFQRVNAGATKVCVLPGGRVILGRWFDARPDSVVNVMSGPFVFWNVDESEAEVPIDGKEALEFYELMMSYGHY